MASGTRRFSAPSVYAELPPVSTVYTPPRRFSWTGTKWRGMIATVGAIVGRADGQDTQCPGARPGDGTPGGWHARGMARPGDGTPGDGTPGDGTPEGWHGGGAHDDAGRGRVQVRGLGKGLGQPSRGMGVRQRGHRGGRGRPGQPLRVQSRQAPGHGPGPQRRRPAHVGRGEDVRQPPWSADRSRRLGLRGGQGGARVAEVHSRGGAAHDHRQPGAAVAAHERRALQLPDPRGPRPGERATSTSPTATATPGSTSTPPTGSTYSRGGSRAPIRASSTWCTT